jgi:hypothetical protein
MEVMSTMTRHDEARSARGLLPVYGGQVGLGRNRVKNPIGVADAVMHIGWCFFGCIGAASVVVFFR